MGGGGRGLKECTYHSKINNLGTLEKLFSCIFLLISRKEKLPNGCLAAKEHKRVVIEGENQKRM